MTSPSDLTEFATEDRLESRAEFAHDDPGTVVTSPVDGLDSEGTDQTFRVQVNFDIGSVSIGLSPANANIQHAGHTASESDTSKVTTSNCLWNSNWTEIKRGASVISYRYVEKEFLRREQSTFAHEEDEQYASRMLKL